MLSREQRQKEKATELEQLIEEVVPPTALRQVHIEVLADKRNLTKVVMRRRIKEASRGDEGSPVTPL